MIIKKNDDRNLLPTDVIGSSVARSKTLVGGNRTYLSREKNG